MTELTKQLVDLQNHDDKIEFGIDNSQFVTYPFNVGANFFLLLAKGFSENGRGVIYEGEFVLKREINSNKLLVALTRLAEPLFNNKEKQLRLSIDIQVH